MAHVYRLRVYQTILENGLVPLYYHPDIEVLERATAACFAGGAQLFEFTNRGDGAYRVFLKLYDFVRQNYPEVILGVGSVLDAGTAALYINSGANFIVGSVFNSDIARLCNKRKIAYIPGCASATEISNAEEYGVEIIKIFPGSTVGGPKFVKSILAPTPWSLIMPTGGVDYSRENLESWFDSGVCAVGMGSALFPADLSDKANYDDVEEKTRQVLQWIREIKGMTHDQ